MTARPPEPSASIAAVLDSLVRAAHAGVPSAASVSITLVNEAGPRTAAASSSWAALLDEEQFRTGSGPGVDAALSGETLAMTDAASETRWPAYVAAALTRGAGSSLSVPIPVDADGLVASLNAYAAWSQGFTDVDEAVLARLAGTAAVALTTSETSSHVRRSRAVIDQAKGIVMVRDGGSAAQALDTLRRTADASGRSLRDVAGGLVRDTGGA